MDKKTKERETVVPFMRRDERVSVKYRTTRKKERAQRGKGEGLQC